MLKFCTFLILVPLAVLAEDPNTQSSNEKVFHVRENHPKLQGLELELTNGQVITLKEFLSNISEEDSSNEVIMFGGEVPWPGVDPDDKDDNKND